MKFPLMSALMLLTIVAPAPQPSRQWRPATFRGITVGKSRLSEMLRAWGKPKWSRSSKQETEESSPQVTWTNYERVGEFPGSTTVVSDTRTGVITRINFYPDRLTKDQAIAHFGSGFVITRYAFDSCLDEEDDERIYESPAGPLAMVEYRARGIAIYLGYQDLVTRISYLRGPVGSAKSKCGQ